MEPAKRRDGSNPSSAGSSSPGPNRPPGSGGTGAAPGGSAASNGSKRRESKGGDKEAASTSSGEKPDGTPRTTDDQIPRRATMAKDPAATARKLEDTFRDEIARQIFGEIGTIRDDFSCAVESKILLHGRMYITDKFICFYSNFFGFEKKIKIPFSHVLKITKGNTALLIPNGINVVTSRKEYSFRSFWDRDECYFQMVNNIRSYRHLSAETREAIYDSRSVDKDGVLEKSTPPPPPPPPDKTSPTTPAGSAAGESKDEPSRGQKGSPGERRKAPTKGEPAEAEEGGEMEGEGTESVSTDEDEVLDFDAMIEGAPSDQTEDLQDEFQKAMEEQPLKEKGLDLQLQCSIQEFFEEFVADKAPCGLDRYHESQGDKVLEFTAWDKVNQSVGATRNLRFETPLKDLPVGPSSAPLLKQQRVRVFGRYGMILETSVSMENVPAADCFTIEDRWVIKAEAPPSEGQGGAGVSMHTSFEVKFIKSTIFKKMIESRTRTDELNFHQRWFEMAQSYLVQKRHDRTPPRRPRPPPPAPAPPKQRPTNPVVRLVRRVSEPVAMAATTTVKRIKWRRLGAAVLVFMCMFYLLRLFLRMLLPPPEPLPLHEVIQELQALRAEVKELTKALREFRPAVGTA